MISKQKVRKKALESRDGLDPAWRLENSRRITENIVDSQLYRKAEIVLSYSSIRSEVGMDMLNRTVLEQGKRLYLPKTDPLEKQIRFYPVKDMALLQRGYQGILEPEETTSPDAVFGEERGYSREQILMVMPGSAFDKNGNRMGYGGGYYDRYLCKYGQCLTSLFAAFYEQKVFCIPVEPFDKKPDHIMTQRGLFEIEGGDRI